MAVSLTTEQKLRAAMDRLCNGTSQRTNGQLTVSNLAKEAGVSRATANRAEVVLIEFHNRVIALQETPEKLPGLRDQNRELERRLAQMTTEKNQIIADFQTTVTLLAQQIQALTLENERLRTSMVRSVDNVTELPRR
jgi:DeoR/GlpR family transcriptional regulator of sugar metabolism